MTTSLTASFVFLAICLFISPPRTSCAAVQGRKDDYRTFGTVLLDSLTFPKVVPNDRNYVFTMVCNKGGIGKLSTDGVRDAFLAAAEEQALGEGSHTLLFTQVIVNGAQNRRVAGRIGCKDDFVHPKFFIFRPGSNESIAFSHEDSPAVTFVEVTRFVYKETGIYLGAPGTIDALDQIVEKFRSVSAQGEAGAILAEMKEAVAALLAKRDPASEPSADAIQQYVKTMEKMLVDPSFASQEVARLEAILESDRVTNARKQQFFERANVIKRFM